jgi:hypothetical protein
MVPPPHFDYEKLDVYQLELKFLTLVARFDPDQYRVGESASGLATAFEDEHEDEDEDEHEQEH